MWSPSGTSNLGIDQKISCSRVVDASVLLVRWAIMKRTTILSAASHFDSLRLEYIFILTKLYRERLVKRSLTTNQSVASSSEVVFMCLVIESVAHSLINLSSLRKVFLSDAVNKKLWRNRSLQIYLRNKSSWENILMPKVKYGFVNGSRNEA